jgi:hypothetical protein
MPDIDMVSEIFTYAIYKKKIGEQFYLCDLIKALNRTARCDPQHIKKKARAMAENKLIIKETDKDGTEFYSITDEQEKYVTGVYLRVHPVSMIGLMNEAGEDGLATATTAAALYSPSVLEQLDKHSKNPDVKAKRGQTR